VRRPQPGTLGAAPDRRPNAEILPQLPCRQHNAQFEHPLDLDLRQRGAAVGDRVAGLEHPVDALDEASEPVAVDLIGAAEIVHHPGLGAFGRGVPGILGQRIIGHRRAVSVAPFGDPQIHAQRIAPI
jgi:hypothetical protein